MSNRQRPSVRLHIEKLVLHGFPPRDRDRIAWAVESELARLLGQGEIPSALSHGGLIPRIDGGTFQMRRGITPKAIGEQVSRNLYGGLDR